jgi:hypothetical protein
MLISQFTVVLLLSICTFIPPLICVFDNCSFVSLLLVCMNVTHVKITVDNLQYSVDPSLCIVLQRKVEMF